MFVCHGNICRSPMAEFIFKDLAKKKGIADHFLVASSATSRKKFGTESAIRFILRQKTSLKDTGCLVAASARCSCKRATMTNTICSFECKRRVITSKHINRACDRFDGNVGHQKLHRGKESPAEAGQKLSFSDWNPKLAVSLIALISPVPMCHHKLRSIFQLIS